MMSVSNFGWLKSLGPGSRRRLTVAGLCALTLATASCDHEQINPFDPKKLGDANRAASVDQSTADLQRLPTTYRSWEGDPRRVRRPDESLPKPPEGKVATGNEPTRAITLADVVRRVAVNNLDVKTAGYGPGIEAARIIEAQARFDPTFFANASADITNRQTAGTPFSIPSALSPTGFSSTTIIDRTRTTQFTSQAGVRQILESGGQVEASYQIRQTDSNPNNTIIDPFREADLVLQLTQPLLRDAGSEVNRARIDIARNTTRISFFDFRTAMEDALDRAEEAYWSLVDAQRQVTIQEQRLRGAEQTADIISARLETDQSRLQLNLAAGQVEIRRAALARARARVRDFSDLLKRYMNDPELPSASAVLLVAESTPLDQPVTFDVNDLIETALQHRTELAQQQLRVDNATVTGNAARNNLLPRLDFQGRVNPNGTTGGFDTAISSQWDFNKISYTLGLQFEIPLGNREARSIYRRTQLQRLQAVTQYQSLIEQVAQDVRTRHREVETTWTELSRSRAARFAQEGALNSILAQEAAAEPLTPNFIDLKLRIQDELAQAQLQESAALSAYNTAIQKLERAKGTLLKYNNITLEEKNVRRPSL